MTAFTSEQRRLGLVVRALAASFLICMAFSGRLWLSTRLYPLVPMFGSVPRFPFPLDVAVLVVLVALLAGLIVRPRSRPLAAGVVTLLALLFAQDQSRLWPSFYLFSLMLLLLAGRRGDGGEQGAARTLAGMRFAVAMSYCWAGVQKLNPDFFHGEFARFLEPLTGPLPAPATALPVIAAGAAVGESLFGLGLLTRRFRRPALAAALVMHALVFVCIGPLRGHWNDSAWIWSQTMAVLVWLLFAGAPPFRWAAMFDESPGRNASQVAVIVLLGILPVLNNVNRWDSALSFNVYSGNVSVARVVLPPGAADGLPAEIAAHAVEQDGCPVIDLDAWSMRAFNALTYPEPRVFTALFAEICRRLPECGARLVIVEKAGWFIPRKTTVLDCANRRLASPPGDAAPVALPADGVARPTPAGTMDAGP